MVWPWWHQMGVAWAVARRLATMGLWAALKETLHRRRSYDRGFAEGKGNTMTFLTQRTRRGGGGGTIIYFLQPGQLQLLDLARIIATLDFWFSEDYLFCIYVFLQLLVYQSFLLLSKEVTYIYSVILYFLIYITYCW
jgi:hypothetical protein